MKDYPSIRSSVGQSFREFHGYIFDKLDGSNIRFEWSKKQGWYKFGSRTRLLDESDPHLGSAIPIFMETLSEPLAKIFTDARYERCMAFAEFWGAKSFAGLHESADPKFITLFDIAPYKKGILGPREFLKTYGHLEIAPFLGEMKWTRGFVDRVRAGEIEGITFEGVVGKTGEGHHLLMAKAKTQAWINAVRAKYSEADANRILNS